MQLHLGIRAGSLLDTDHHLAAFGELHRIIAKIDQHLPKAQWIADQGGRQLRWRLEKHFERLVLRLHTDQAGQIIEHILESKVDLLEIHFARFDFRKIENVVNDPQQVLGRAVDLVDIVFLLRREIGLQGQVRHTDNGIHRRADFVTHIGQKIGFGLGRLQRNRRRLRQLFIFKLQALE